MTNAPVRVRFYLVEAALLHYYSHLFATDPRKVARGMLKRGVASDREIDYRALASLLGRVPEFVENPSMAKEAKADLAALIASREGKKDVATTGTVGPGAPGIDPLSGADCHFTVTALEFLLLSYYGEREKCTREQALRRFLRKYVLEDANFDIRRFKRFLTTEIAPQLDARRRERLDEEVKAFFLPRQRREEQESASDR